MSNKRSPRELNADILAALDLISEYQRLGVRFKDADPRPRSNGWVECYARGRDESHPSAAINVRTGRYVDKGGDCESLGFFDFAVKYGNHGDFRAARKHYADLVGMKLDGHGRPSKRPEANFEFLEWTDGNVRLAKIWCETKKHGVTVESIRALGGQVAMYPKTSRKFKVIVLPVYGHQWLDAEPVGFVIYDIHGRELPVWKEGGGVDRHVKMKTIGPVSGGLIGLHALSRLTGPASDAPVDLIWVTEGPSDAMALWSAIPERDREQHLVVCNAGGAQEDVRPHVAELFAGRAVAVVRDADVPGEIGAEKWCIGLHGSAADVRHIRTPYAILEKKGHDLRDFLLGRELADGTQHDYPALLQVYRDSELFTPRAAVATIPDRVNGHEIPMLPALDPAGLPIPDDEIIERRMCSALGIDVIGESTDGTILVFAGHESRRKDAEINRIDYLSYSKLLQIAGTPVKELVVENDTDDEGGSDAFTVPQVRNAIAYLAGRHRLGQQSVNGIGCWPELDAHGNEIDGVVVVGSKEASCFRPGSGTQKFEGMRGGGRLLRISDPNRWYSHDDLSSLLEKVTPAYAQATIEEAEALFGRWRWRSDLSPTMLVGLVLATWVQTLWSWRPQVAITGSTSTGKSMLFDTLSGIFGSLAICSSKSSEPGLRQAIQKSGRVMLCDEFEKSTSRDKILEMMRGACRGETVVMGTTGQKDPMEFVIRHIFWIAAIETGLRRAPDRNRFITLEALPPLTENSGKLTSLPTAQLHHLGQRLLAIAVANILSARKLAVRLKAKRHPGVDGRVIESYAVPVAMLATCVGGDDEAADRMLTKFLEDLPKDESRASDEEDLLQSILRSLVVLGPRETCPVAKLIATTGSDAREALERVGIGMVSTRRGRQNGCGGTHMFIDHRAVSEHLLSRSEWANQSIDQILRRLPGAEKRKCSIGNRRAHGVTIPFQFVEETFLTTDGSPYDEMPE